MAVFEIFASSSTRDFIARPTFISALNYSLCGYFNVITWLWYFHFNAPFKERRSLLLWLPRNNYFTLAKSKKIRFGICSSQVKCRCKNYLKFSFVLVSQYTCDIGDQHDDSLLVALLFYFFWNASFVRMIWYFVYAGLLFLIFCCHLSVIDEARAFFP